MKTFLNTCMQKYNHTNCPEVQQWTPTINKHCFVGEKIKLPSLFSEMPQPSMTIKQTFFFISAMANVTSLTQPVTCSKVQEPARIPLCMMVNDTRPRISGYFRTWREYSSTKKMANKIQKIKNKKIKNKKMAPCVAFWVNWRQFFMRLFCYRSWISS